MYLKKHKGVQKRIINIGGIINKSNKYNKYNKIMNIISIINKINTINIIIIMTTTYMNLRQP